jgi:hypothetical protein
MHSLTAQIGGSSKELFQIINMSISVCSIVLSLSIFRSLTDRCYTQYRGGGKLKLIELLYIADYILDERCETETNQDLQQYNKTSMTAL